MISVVEDEDEVVVVCGACIDFSGGFSLSKSAFARQLLNTAFTEQSNGCNSLEVCEGSSRTIMLFLRQASLMTGETRELCPSKMSTMLLSSNPSISSLLATIAGM